MKVISTYGPSLSGHVLKEVCKLSDVIRINISHQTPERAEEIFSFLERFGKPIMIDTSGPEVRIRGSYSINLKKGDILESGFISAFT